MRPLALTFLLFIAVIARADSFQWVGALQPGDAGSLVTLDPTGTTSLGWSFAPYSPERSGDPNAWLGFIFQIDPAVSVMSDDLSLGGLVTHLSFDRDTGDDCHLTGGTTCYAALAFKLALFDGTKLGWFQASWNGQTSARYSLSVTEHASPAQVPEPTSFLLLGSSLLMAVAVKLRRYV